MEERQTWQNQIDAEEKRRIQAEKARIDNSRFQVSPERLELNRQRDLGDKRVVETLQGMVIFNTDIVPVLSSFNQEVWDNLGTIGISDCSLKHFSGKWTKFIEKTYGFKSITLAHESISYLGEYEDVKRTKHGRYTRTGGGGGGGWNSPGSEPTWSKDKTGSYTEVGRRLVKINENKETDSIFIMLGYSDTTGLFELRVADNKVAIDEPDSFTEFPDKRRIYDPPPGAYRDNEENIGYLTNDRYDAILYDIAYEQLYRDPTVRPATDLPQRLMMSRNPYGVESRYKKVPFENYTLVSHKGQVALFFSKDAVNRGRILNFLNRALVVAGTNRRIDKKLPQDIDYKNKGLLRQLQSMLDKKDFSDSRTFIQHRYFGTSWKEDISPDHKE